MWFFLYIHFCCCYAAGSHPPATWPLLVTTLLSFVLHDFICKTAIKVIKLSAHFLQNSVSHRLLLFPLSRKPMCHWVYLLRPRGNKDYCLSADLSCSALMLSALWLSAGKQWNNTLHIKRNSPAHLVKEAVGFGHSIELMFMLLEEIHIALLWDKLQQLKDKEKTFHYIEYSDTSAFCRQWTCLNLCFHCLSLQGAWRLPLTS